MGEVALEQMLVLSLCENCLFCVLYFNKYFLLQTTQNKSGSYLFDIHFWIGRDTSQVFFLILYPALLLILTHSPCFGEKFSDHWPLYCNIALLAYRSVVTIVIKFWDGTCLIRLLSQTISLFYFLITPVKPWKSFTNICWNLENP